MEDKNNNSKTMITRVAIIACLLFIAQYMYKSQSTELIHETIYNTIQDTTTIEKPNQSLSNGVVLAKSDILDQAEKKVEPAIDKNSNEPVRYEYFRDNGYTNIKSYL